MVNNLFLHPLKQDFNGCLEVWFLPEWNCQFFICRHETTSFHYLSDDYNNLLVTGLTVWDLANYVMAVFPLFVCFSRSNVNNIKLLVNWKLK